MGGSNDLQLDSITDNLLERLAELREAFYLLDYRFIQKDVTQKSHIEEMHRARYGKGYRAPMPCPLCQSLKSPHVHQPRSSPKPSTSGDFILLEYS